MSVVSPLVEELEASYDLNGPGQVVIILARHWVAVCCDVSTPGFLIPISVNVQLELVASSVGVEWITFPLTTQSSCLVLTELS